MSCAASRVSCGSKETICFAKASKSPDTHTGNVAAPKSSEAWDGRKVDDAGACCGFLLSWLAGSAAASL